MSTNITEDKKKTKNIGVQFSSAAYCISQKYDANMSMIYGFIWSKCQLSKGVCTTSFETISIETGISERTVRSKVQELIENKLVKIVGREYQRHGYVYQLLYDEDNLKALDKEINSIQHAVVMGMDKFNMRLDKVYKKAEQDTTEYSTFTDAFRALDKMVREDVLKEKVVEANIANVEANIANVAANIADEVIK